jgi:hypothetical protein
MKYSKKWGCSPIPIQRTQIPALLEAFGHVTKMLHRDYHLPSPDMPWLPANHFSFRLAFDPDRELITAFLPAHYSLAKTADTLTTWGIPIDVEELDAADTGSHDVTDDRDLFESDLPPELQPFKSLIAWTTEFNFVITE